MIALPIGLVGPAHEAGIAVPDDPMQFDYDKASPEEQSKYVRWVLFCSAQLGQPMPSPSSHWENAKIIAQIPEDELMTITSEGLERLGFQIGYSKP